MKKKLTLLFVAAASLFVTAQECGETLSLMSSSAKAGDPAAYTYLDKLRKDCPTESYLTYVYGAILFNKKIDAATTEAEKIALKDELFKLYDEYETHFPEKAVGLNMDKGLVLFNNGIGTKDEIYNFLDKGFTLEKNSFDSPRALYAYFELYVNKYNAGTYGLELQQVFDKYDDVNLKIAEENKKNSEEIDAYLVRIENNEALSSKEKRKKAKLEGNLVDLSTVSESMDTIIMSLSSCDRLIPFYQKAFELNKNDEQWLQRAADRLEAKECDEDPLFSKISEALYRLNPSAEAAYKLGIVESQRGNSSKSMDYFNQAANLFEDSSKKAAVYYKMAAIYSKSSRSQARTYARKALAVKPSYGKAYLLIASLYGSSINECGDDQFNRRAVYWLAAQYADKAAANDPSLRSKANSVAAQYRAAAPSKQEIFSSGKQGQRIAFPCWIGESVTVPSL